MIWVAGWLLSTKIDPNKGAAGAAMHVEEQLAAGSRRQAKKTGR